MIDNKDDQNNTFNSITDGLKLRRERRLDGKYNSIITPFKRLNKVFPGFEKGKFIIVTANSGIGKTKITKFLFVTSVYNFCKVNNIPLKIFYFALEETSEEFWLSILANKLQEKYGIIIDVGTLKSLGENTITQDILNKIEELRLELIPMMNCITVVDDVNNPYGLYKIGREYAESNGIYTGEKFNRKYKANNPEEIVFTITDHISFLSAEKNHETNVMMSQWESIGHYSKEYCLKGFCKRWGFINIFVQQQESSKEKQQYTLRGESVEDKLEPSLDGLATNKETQREADMIIGLFAPDRYKIENHRGYDIITLKDCYRSMIFLKDRHYGLANTYVPLLMNGRTNNFYELPKKEELSREKYEQLLKKVK